MKDLEDALGKTPLALATIAGFILLLVLVVGAIAGHIKNDDDVRAAFDECDSHRRQTCTCIADVPPITPWNDEDSK